MLYIDDLTDKVSVLTHIDSFTEGLGCSNVMVDTDTVEGVVKGMKLDFPSIDGDIEAASSFKKVANFLCFFIAQQPIKRSFDESIIGSDLYNVNNHQNVMTAYDLAVTCLEGATILRLDGTCITLDNRIRVSKHTYIDLIHALKTISPSTHFHVVSLLLEQMAYKANPDASYELVI